MTLASNKYTNQQVSVSGTYSVKATDSVLLCDTSSAPVVINLDSIPANYWSTQYKLYVVDNSGNAGTNNITINAGSGQTINGVASATININNGAAVVSISGNTKYVTGGAFSSSGGGGGLFDSKILTRFQSEHEGTVTVTTTIRPKLILITGLQNSGSSSGSMGRSNGTDNTCYYTEFLGAFISVTNRNFCANVQDSGGNGYSVVINNFTATSFDVVYTILGLGLDTIYYLDILG